MSDQSDTPLLTALHEAAQRDRAVFHTPGHKQGQGSPSRLAQRVGAATLQADLPELPELDNLFAPEGAIEAAQNLAAEAFGAAQTYFLANGSTCGIEAAILAVCQPGDKIILPRNAHQSAIAALILSGAIPIWIKPVADPTWGIAHSVTPAAIQDAIDRHPNAKAVLIVSPTYYGVCANLEAIAQITHTHNLPLIVDEAHGAHFAFHPDLPLPALQAGADIAIQSTHKTLSALTQAAMLHIQENRIERDRLQRALQLVQSTSPNYLLLASLDAARQQMATAGKELWSQTIALVEQVRHQIRQIPGIRLLEAEAVTELGFPALDPTRITIDLSNLGISGFEADEILHQQFGVTAELPGLTTLTFILTFGNTHSPAHFPQSPQHFPHQTDRSSAELRSVWCGKC
ncbi:aminotransferase class I/II-fold pyridoxal phosphate-dependent enzyme [Leptolyngbya ohadii]|uniref:aminotransferase class I/II-fold pyridoxal phosphate-dependent enzyme n=1 Tax=Leptolyngbya ohadii TaxID=1962290 RepID=UPI000B5A011C|nr:aminotransferase class I/II-fold pyridoxal phosphate-dependent enzyme [Leptolyngbya ohadii]